MLGIQLPEIKVNNFCSQESRVTFLKHGLLELCIRQLCLYLCKRLWIFKLPTLSGIQFPAIKDYIFLYKTTISFTSENFPTMSGTWFQGMKGYLFRTWAALTLHKAAWSLPKRLHIFKLPTLPGIQFPTIKVSIFGKKQIFSTLTYNVRNLVPRNEGLPFYNMGYSNFA